MRRLQTYLFLISIVTIGLVVPTSTFAHNMAPVLLTVEQKSADRLDVVWRFPTVGGTVAPEQFSLRIDPACEHITLPQMSADAKAIHRVEHYRCEAGSIMVSTMTIVGLESTEHALAMRLVDREGAAVVRIIHKQSDQIVWSDANNDFNAGQYFSLGVEHILGGIDHILFVTLLCFLASRRLASLLGLITAFTAAHSLTLGAAATGWVQFPGRPVEALIAFSIALLAADLVRKDLSTEFKIARYWPIVFAFGLLHGFGFAGALADIGLPANGALLALLSFNVGVEFGQLSFVMMCALVIALIRRFQWLLWAEQAVGYSLGAIACFWFLERV